MAKVLWGSTRGAPSLRPDGVFGTIPAEIAAAGYTQNNLATSVRTDVSYTTRTTNTALPTGSQSTPYTLGTSNTRYYLTADVTFETAGIIVPSGISNWTIDLAGYTLNYLDVSPVGVETGTVDSASGGGGTSGTKPQLTPVSMPSQTLTNLLFEFTSGTENGNRYEAAGSTVSTIDFSNESVGSDSDSTKFIWQSGTAPVNGDTYRCYIPQSTFGIGSGEGIYGSVGEIVNGSITQSTNGYGAGLSKDYAAGMSPIGRSDGSGGWYMGGLSLTWWTPTTCGIRNDGGGQTVEYCEFTDNGTFVSNRHRPVSAVRLRSSGTVRYCRIHEHRHIGVEMYANNCLVEYNEIFGTVYATNGYAIGQYSTSTQSGAIVRYNNVYKLGEHAMGLAIHNNSEGFEYHNNWVECQITTTSSEYGPNNATAFSNRWGTRSAENYYHNNVLVNYSLAYDGPSASLSLSRCIMDAAYTNTALERYENNFIGSYSHDDTTECHAIGTGGQSETTIHRGDIIYASGNLIWGDDDYGYGLDITGMRFVDCEFHQSGSDVSFIPWRVSNDRDVLIDLISNDYYNGIGETAADFGGTWDAGDTYRFGYNVTVTVTDGGSPVEGAAVVVKDASTNILRTGYLTAADGTVVVDCPTNSRHTDGTTTANYNPLSIEASKDAKSGSASVSPTADDTAAVAIV